MTHSLQKKLNSGYLLVLVLVFGSIFFLIAVSFIGYIVTQSQLVRQSVDLQRAGDVAEAGINYYRWFLAHHPNDVTNGTGLPGPYVHTYYDPEGGPIGEFSLSVASTTFCGDVSTLEVTSTGFVYENPSVRRTITARYARPTVAEYSFILNSNVWAGADRVIVGPYHSNGGIRMDGSNNSIVTSGQANWTCTASFGCSPNTVRNGVFTTTANPNTALFSFPHPPINFTGLSINLAQMQDRAQNHGGIFIPPSGAFGYRVTFNGNGTVTVRRVSNTLQYWGSSIEAGWQQERHVISSMNTNTVHTINPACPLIFVQDKVWLDGVVDQKVTLAAADVTSATLNPGIILNGNIIYNSPNAGLLAIAEQDVLVGLEVPNNMTANGIFIAQNGRFSRNHYTDSGSNALPVGLRNFRLRDSLVMNGTIVSNGRVGTQWTSGGGAVLSGFLNRVNTYDRNLVVNPPPLVPNTSDLFVITDWRDER